ncbi:hypothetical protein DXB19_13235 [Lachnospiraceae bacterium OM02-26]|nr:hypothetical protein DXB19_13235 [Lachnospiraceae bacterium OM02-26]
MENLLFKLTEYQYEILMAILERPGQNPGDFFFDFPSIDGYVDMFLKAKLVSINESDELSITELGRAHLAEFELQQKIEKEREAQHQQQIDAITSIAETAKQNAISAESDSKLSKIISILSLIVAIASVIVDIV